jgi:uncharacterized protein (TIGR02466 family)
VLPPFRFARAFQLFPTLVFQHGVPGHEELNTDLERVIRGIKKKHPLWKGKPRPWQCHPDLHTQAPFAPLVEAVDRAVAIAHEALHYRVEGHKITGMWATSLMEGEQHPAHTHANNFWSGVYYVRCSAPTTARITFMHPNPAAKVLLPQRTELNMSNATSWSLDAEPGTLVLFPAWLEHSVAPIPKGERISIAFNVMLTGDLLEPDSLQFSRVG